MVKETCCGTAQWANAAQPHLFTQRKVFILIPSKATFSVALEVFVCPFPPIPIADNPAISSPTHTKTHAFALQSVCFYRAIQLQLLDNLVAIASQFAAIAQITCVTKARNDVFMLVHAGVDGRTPNGGFLVGKRLFDVFNAFG